jgi:hypothetical protein
VPGCRDPSRGGVCLEELRVPGAWPRSSGGTQARLLQFPETNHPGVGASAPLRGVGLGPWLELAAWSPLPGPLVPAAGIRLTRLLARTPGTVCAPPRRLVRRAGGPPTTAISTPSIGLAIWQQPKARSWLSDRDTPATKQPETGGRSQLRPSGTGRSGSMTAPLSTGGPGRRSRRVRGFVSGVGTHHDLAIEVFYLEQE